MRNSIGNNRLWDGGRFVDEWIFHPLVTGRIHTGNSRFICNIQKGGIELKRYRWKHSVYAAQRDKLILKNWEDGLIDNEECARLISENNGRPMNPEDVPAIAESLGFIRGMEDNNEEGDQGDKELSEDDNSEVRGS